MQWPYFPVFLKWLPSFLKWHVHAIKITVMVELNYKQAVPCVQKYNFHYIVSVVLHICQIHWLLSIFMKKHVIIFNKWLLYTACLSSWTFLIDILVLAKIWESAAMFFVWLFFRYLILPVLVLIVFTYFNLYHYLVFAVFK